MIKKDLAVYHGVPGNYGPKTDFVYTLAIGGAILDVLKYRQYLNSDSPFQSEIFHVLVKLGEELFYESENIPFTITLKSVIAFNATLCSVLFFILFTMKKRIATH